MNGNVDTMEYRGQRLFTLLGNLRQDLTDMIKSELALLKSEISATVSSMGKDGVTILIGGFIAYTGAVLALIGLATLVAFAIHKAGLSVLMAMWISFLAFGLLVALTGYMLLKSGISKLKEVKVAPKETISTVKEFVKGETNGSGIVASKDLKDEASEKTHQARVRAEKKIEKIHNELADVQARLKPQYMWKATCTA
ncbi:MAG TPA: phage holin family protein, partial [Verrucomicrobiae bacterium]